MKKLFGLLLLVAAQFSQAQPNTVPVLMYHQINSDKKADGTNITKSRFEEHIRFLKENGYNTVTIQELTEFMQGKRELPKKSVAITIDDGWRSTFNAVEVLANYQSKATLYIISGTFSNPEYLSASEVFALSQNKYIEIGAHTHTHFMEWFPDVKKIDPRVMVGEAFMSKHILEGVIGRPVNSLSWPFGYTRPEVIEYAKKIGFTSQVMVNGDSKNSKGMSPHDIHRINIDGNCTVEDLRSMVETGILEECKHAENDKKTIR